MLDRIIQIHRYLLVAVLLLVYLNSDESERTYVHPELRVHTQAFWKVCHESDICKKSQLPYVSRIELVPDLKGKLGLCIMSLHILNDKFVLDRKIYILKIRSKKLTRLVTYHEMMHCYFDTEHIEGHPLMHPYLPYMPLPLDIYDIDNYLRDVL